MEKATPSYLQERSGAPNTKKSVLEESQEASTSIWPSHHLTKGLVAGRLSAWTPADFSSSKGTHPPGSAHRRPHAGGGSHC